MKIGQIGPTFLVPEKTVNFFRVKPAVSSFTLKMRKSHKKLARVYAYDAVSDVVESGVHWRSDFQIGSRVLKICFKPILMHIYGMQYDFMHRSC